MRVLGNTLIFSWWCSIFLHTCLCHAFVLNTPSIRSTPSSLLIPVNGSPYYNDHQKIKEVNLLSSTPRKKSSLSSTNNNAPVIDETKAVPTTTSTTTSAKTGISQSADPEYPYQFTGRLWFCPSIVKLPKITDALSSKSVDFLSLFGYTLGGTVTLEYDTSPVGPYKEFVTMSSLVTKNGAIGQWGSRLYVSTQEAEDVCKDIWGVPAEFANIEFYEEGRKNAANDTEDDVNTEKKNAKLMVTKPPVPFAKADDVQDIYVEGWKRTRVLEPNEYSPVDGTAKRLGNIPVLWTPTIKALWSPWLAGGVRNVNNADNIDDTIELPLHKLRLSASAIRLRWSGLRRNLDEGVDSITEKELGVPLGVGLVVDNVLIEIGKPWGRF